MDTNEGHGKEVLQGHDGKKMQAVMMAQLNDGRECSSSPHQHSLYWGHGFYQSRESFNHGVGFFYLGPDGEDSSAWVKVCEP